MTQTNLRRRAFMTLAWATFTGGALGAAWTTRAYRRDISAARARAAQGSSVIQTRAGPIEVGISDGTRPLLMIHGTGGGSDQGLQFAERLSAAGWRVIAPSRFGYLRTPFPADASSEAQADAFVAMLDVLGIERLPVLGGSAGALSAIQLALRHPQRCSALVPIVPATYVPGRAETPPASPWTQLITETLLRSDFLFWSAINTIPNAMFASLLATNPALIGAASTVEQARARSILRNILPVSSRAQGLLNDSQLARHPSPVALESIQVPTLAISVEDDGFGTFAAAQHIASTVPGARLLSFKTGGHLWVGHDIELFGAVDAFLRASTA